MEVFILMNFNEVGSKGTSENLVLKMPIIHDFEVYNFILKKGGTLINDEGKIKSLMGLASAKADSVEEFGSIKANSENQLASAKAEYIMKKASLEIDDINESKLLRENFFEDLNNSISGNGFTTDLPIINKKRYGNGFADIIPSITNFIGNNKEL